MTNPRLFAPYALGLLLCGCAGAPIVPNADSLATNSGESASQPAPAAQAHKTPTPPGWKRVQASGQFTVALPPSFERRYVQGIDSAVDQFVAPDAELHLDYGWYGGGGLGSDATEVRTGKVVADGRVAEWAMGRLPPAPDQKFPWAFRAHFAGLERPPGFRYAPGTPPPPNDVGLGVGLYCATAQACAAGSDILRTIRFGPPRPLIERIVFLQRTGAAAEAGLDRREGLLIVDSDGCLRLTDNQGVPGPILVWPAEGRLEPAGRPELARIAGGLGGDTVQVGAFDWVIVSGRETADPAVRQSLGRAAPQACAGPLFLVHAFETPQGRRSREGSTAGRR